MKKRVLVVFALCMTMLTLGCGKDSTPTNQNQEESIAVETTLSAGEWYVGEDIPAGRYTITSPDQDGGNIAIYNEGEDFATDSTIIDPDGDIGVKSWTYELKAGQKVKVSNTDSMLFTPKE